MKFWLIRLASLAAGVGLCLAIDAFANTRNDFEARLIILAGLYVTLAVSLNLINGICGQFSIGHAAFYQIGAYTAGYCSLTYFTHAHIPGLPWLLLMMLLGAVCAGIAGFVVGLPSLRLRGDYLAIVTLGFGEIIRIIVENTDKVGGSYGMNVSPKFRFVWLVWLLAFLCIAVCRNLLKTAKGLVFLSVREDEVASQAMGVNVTRTKVTAFVLGSAFAGAAGALLAHYEGFITPTMFTMDVSFIILTMVVLGGTGSITGSAIAAALLFYLPEKLRDLPPISGSAIVGAVIAVILAVVLIRKVTYRYFGSNLKKAGLYGLALAAALLVYFLGTWGFGRWQTLSSVQFEADRLRMVIFAGSLIVIMLIRPQGVLAHHEFSWSMIGRWFGNKAPVKAVST